MAFSTEKIGAEAATTMRSVTMTHVPTATPVRRARIWQRMSVPPVLLPALNTRPRPTPQMTPPQRAQSKRSDSPSTGSAGASASMATAESTTPASERST